MITDLNSSYDNGNNYLKADKLCGVSTDSKPTNVGNGSTFHEIDTGKDYMYDAGGQTWYEQPSPGGGGGDNGLFIVNFAETEDESVFVPDKTLAEALAAAEDGAMLIANVEGFGNGIRNYLTDSANLAFNVMWFGHDSEDNPCLNVQTIDWTPGDDDSDIVEASYYKVVLTPDE